MPHHPEKSSLHHLIEAQRSYLSLNRLVYDKRFLNLESLDPRRKAAIDLDGTLIDYGGYGLRPNAIEFLTRLRKAGVKTVLWTTSPRVQMYRSLELYNLYKYFDLLIGEENDFATCSEAENFFEMYPHSTCPSNLLTGNLRKKPGLIGYTVLVDDGTQSLELEEATHYTQVCVPYFCANARENEPLPLDLADQVLSLLGL